MPKMSQFRYITSGILEPAGNHAELYLKVIKPVPHNAEIGTHMKILRSPRFGQKYSKYDRMGLEKRISQPQPVRNPLLTSNTLRDETYIVAYTKWSEMVRGPLSE